MFKIFRAGTAFKRKWIATERVLLGLVLFSMPLLPKITTALLIALTCVTSIRYRKEFFRRMLISKELVFYMLLYLLLILGLFYTINLDNGLSKIQTQVFFVLAPIILGGRRFRFWEITFYIRMFVSGTLLAVVICLLNAVRKVYLSGSVFTVDVFGKKHNNFIYNEFSSFLDLHPSYFALYIGLALLLLIFDSAKLLDGHKLSRIVKGCILIIALLLTSSKSGLIAFLMTFMIILANKSIRLKLKISNYKYLVLAILVISLVVINSNLYERISKGIASFHESYESGQAINESTSVRYHLWQLSLSTSKDAFFLGHGTGSVYNALNDHCLEHYHFSTCELLRNKNSHNQYLNFLVSNGLLFVLIFVSALLIGIVRAVKGKNIYLLLFLIFISLNLFFESLLQRERGVIFFMLFLILFLNDNVNMLSNGNKVD